MCRGSMERYQSYWRDRHCNPAPALSGRQRERTRCALSCPIIRTVHASSACSRLGMYTNATVSAGRFTGELVHSDGEG